MKKTSKGLRTHVGIFGRRNAGKSSLLNAMSQSECAIVSDQPGTTTDPVEKIMEIQPLGPVVMIDTAGLDDVGSVGAIRVARSRAVIDRCDVGLVVARPDAWGALERDLIEDFARRQTSTAVVFTHRDLAAPPPDSIEWLHARRVPWSSVSLTADHASDESARRQSKLAELLRKVTPEARTSSPPLLADLMPPGGLALLVVPIDPEAPKGRLILPQVQTIRQTLDHDAMVLVVKERELAAAMSRLHAPPDLVVTDSQAFLRVAADVPRSVSLTSFSILFARVKGDLEVFVEGARAIDELREGSRVLVSEACGHHPTGEDIARVKIPRWLTQYVGAPLEFEHVQGRFPDSVAGFDLVLHCGGCTKNRQEIVSRVRRCQAQSVPMTNYGLCIAYSLGIFERALEPFSLT